MFAAFWLSFAAAQVLSWRHSSGERRQQLKWLMSGAAAPAVSQAVDQVSIVVDSNTSASVNAMLDLITGLGLAARLQDAVDLNAVRDDLAGVVHKTLEPIHVSVWMSRGRG